MRLPFKTDNFPSGQATFGVATLRSRNRSQRLVAPCADAAGSNTEWSFACPGNGIALDCCSLLTSVLSVEVVAAASLVGPAGATPNTVVLGVVAGAEFKGMSALIGGGSFSEHPTLATTKEIKIAQNR